MYTDADLTNINKAISDLMAGKRVTRITIGSQSTEFGQASLSELIKLRSVIVAELQSQTQATAYRVATSKGL